MSEKQRQNIGLVLLFLFFSLFLVNMGGISETNNQEAKSQGAAAAPKESFVEKVEKHLGTQQHNAPRYTLNNKELSFDIFARGAQIQASLNEYKGQQGNVVLHHPDHSTLFWQLTNKKGQKINTCELDFNVKKENEQRVICTYHQGQQDAITITYTLKDCLLSAKIQIGKAWNHQSQAELNFYSRTQRQEKSENLERRKTYLSFGPSYTYEVSTKKGEAGKIIKDTRWVNCHMGFFNLALFFPSQQNLEAGIEGPAKKEDPYLKRIALSTSIPTEKLQKSEGYAIDLHIGPNKPDVIAKVTKHYPTLNYGSVHYTGWFIFGAINRWVISPLFNVLNGFFNNPMLALFLLLLLLSLCFYPLTYRQHIQKVKMKAAKPYLDKLKAAANEDGNQTKYIESNFYRKVGINPLIPLFEVLKSMCLFVSLISFASYSMAFRQQRFLWISDLSSFDDFIRLPFNLPMIGGHISIIALTLLLIPMVSKRFSKEEVTLVESTEKQKAMKIMGYISPFLFFGITNGRPAVLGLSRLFGMVIGKVEKTLCQKVINSEPIIQEVVRRANTEDNETEGPSRSMTRLEKRMERKKSKK